MEQVDYVEEEESQDSIYERMMGIMAKSKINFNTLISRLQLKEKDVVNVYMNGSRLWGTATYASDYDFIIVMSTWTGKASLHSGDIDATVYDLKEFIERVKNHSFHEMACIWLPKPYIWKQDYNIHQNFEINHDKMKDSIFEETDRDWRMAKKYFEKENVDRGKKTIVHAFRLLLLSIQILKDGCITNFHETCKYTNEMAQNDSESWDWYDHKYTPLFEEFRERLNELARRKEPVKLKLADNIAEKSVPAKKNNKKT